MGGNKELAEEVRKHLKRMKDWQKENPTKYPD